MNELATIQSMIHEIRGIRVMLDFDLAQMYGVETRVLNQAVKRNIERFPEDFMFQLTETDWTAMSSQFVMTSRMKRPKSSLPFVFSEHGALMLSSVLRSAIAVEMSIKVTRAFVAMRNALATMLIPASKDDVARLRKDFEELKQNIEDIMRDQNYINESTRAQLDAISMALAELQSKEPDKEPRRRIGFT